MAQEAHHRTVVAAIRRLEKELLEKERIIEEWKLRWEEKKREVESYNRELIALKDLYKERARELRVIMEKLEEVSITDDLTQIFNHRYLISRLHYEFERAKRYRLSLSFAMLDIDHFKMYNDNNGHLAGDEALRKVAGLIQGAIRETDIVGRYGGEEFAIILLHADLTQVAEVAERIRGTIEEASFPNEEVQPMGRITVSLGGCCLSQNMETAEDLIRSADEALYSSKNNGRNQVTIGGGSPKRARISTYEQPYNRYRRNTHQKR